MTARPTTTLSDGNIRLTPDRSDEIAKLARRRGTPASVRHAIYDLLLEIDHPREELRASGVPAPHQLPATASSGEVPTP